jgi:hypothetical protein
MTIGSSALLSVARAPGRWICARRDCQPVVGLNVPVNQIGSLSLALSVCTHPTFGKFYSLG